MDTFSGIIRHGDALHLLRQIADGTIDAIVTDPPYGLSDLKTDNVVRAITAWTTGDRELVPSGKGFMGNSWDGFVPPPAIWDECLRVLKPGGHMLVFASARTADLMGLSVRLAGFELRDSLYWLYGSGMPKSLNVAKAMRKANDRAGTDVYRPDEWKGWGTTLKPAAEPILLARKPTRGTVADTVSEYGTGALHIDACRIPFTSLADESESKTKNRHGRFGTKHGGNTVYGDYTMLGVRADYNPPGRWPSNVMLSHSPECDSNMCSNGCPVAGLDRQSGITQSRKGAPRASQRNDNDVFGGSHAGFSGHVGPEYDDIGGASRFFYVAKATANERPSYTTADGTRIIHPTVKPLKLMRHLVRLITPPGGTVLDPFAGSGTTGEAAIMEGFTAVLLEREATYLPLIRQRIERARRATSGPTTAAS